MKFNKPITINSVIDVTGWTVRDKIAAVQCFKEALGAGEHYSTKRAKVAAGSRQYVQYIECKGLTCVGIFPSVVGDFIERVDDKNTDFLPRFQSMVFFTNNREHSINVLDMLDRLGYDLGYLKKDPDPYQCIMTDRSGKVFQSLPSQVISSERSRVDVDWLDPMFHCKTRETITVMGRTVYKDELEQVLNDLSEVK